MKKAVLMGFIAFYSVTANAQTFKKGETVEVNKTLSEDDGSWIKADVMDVDRQSQVYSVKTIDKKSYRIPFSKEESWIRRPMKQLTKAGDDAAVVFAPSAELVKQKIQEQFESDFSEYDSVIISFNSVEALPSYSNTDDDLVKKETAIYPYKVDLTLRLVNKNGDGTEKKINWLFKRKYLLFQNQRGKISLSTADKEEQVVSYI